MFQIVANLLYVLTKFIHRALLAVICTKMLATLSSLLLLLALSQGTQSLDCTSCLDTAELDIFKLFTTSSKPTEFFATSLNGAAKTEGHDENEPCYAFTGKQWLRDSGTSFFNQVICGMCSRHEVTFHASVMFNRNDVGGPLLEIFHDISPVFTIAVNPKGSELSLSYLHQNKIAVEKFKVTFDTGVWYRIAFQFSGNLLKMFVNCELSDIRLSLIPDYCIEEDNISVIVGTDAKGKYYHGSLEAVRIVTGDNPIIRQCPNITQDQVECPICGNYLSMVKNLASFQDHIIELEEQLEHLSNNNNCENDPSQSGNTCNIGGTIYSDGEFAKTSDGHICFCQNGVATCKDLSTILVPPEPSVVVSSAPIPSPTSIPAEQSIPHCPEKQVANRLIELEVGETDYTKDGDQCLINHCKKSTFGGVSYGAQRTEPCSDANTDCSSIESTEYDSQNLSICCGVCRACDFATCQPNSMCVNVPPNYECRCKSGFTKVGDVCMDIDECSLPSEDGGHDCPVDSNCKNTEGSFDCECGEFFDVKMINGIKTCADLDECATGNYNCPSNTTCKNKDLGYDCECIDGFELKNDVCIPVCKPACKFGICVDKDTCKCDNGYRGDQCDQDINECETMKDLCIDTSGENVTQCVNTDGGYFCSCLTGLQSVYAMDGKLTCKSFDECKTGLHFCPKNSKCVNTMLGYVCNCIEGNCDGRCVLEDGTILRNNERKLNGCDMCTCKNGIYECTRRPCNCSSELDQNNSCCPQCSRKDYCFGPNELSLKIGEHQFLSGDSCNFLSCKEGSGPLPTLIKQSVTCPELNCPLNKHYKPTSSCCPICTLPTCSNVINGRSLTIKNSNQCETCTCNVNDLNNSGWSCTSCQDNDCPSLNECSSKHVAKLDNCPVCLTSIEHICTS